MIKGRLLVHTSLGYNDHVTVLPIPNKEMESILSLSDVLQRDLADLSGEISFHYPDWKAYFL